MTCRQISKKLSAYLDQELTMGEVKQVEEHLDTCELCRVELAELRITRQATVAALHEMAVSVEPSALAWSRLQSRLSIKQTTHISKETTWLSRLAPGWEAKSIQDFLGATIMKRRIAVLLSGALIFGILGFFLMNQTVTPVSAKQVLEKAYEVHKAANLAKGISHLKVEMFSNPEGKADGQTRGKYIIDNYMDFQTGNHRIVTYFSPELKTSHVEGYDGKYTYSSAYLDRSQKDKTLEVYRSPQSRDKVAGLDNFGPISSAEELFLSMRKNPNITLDSEKTLDDGRKVYVLVTENTILKQDFNINGVVSEKEGGKRRESMMFDASTYELLETDVSIVKNETMILTDSLRFLTREVLPENARVIWDMSDLKDIKMLDDLDRTKGDLLPEKITTKELADNSSNGYLLENVPQGFKLTITAPPNQRNESYFVYVAAYRNAANEYFVIQSMADESVDLYKDDAVEVMDLKDGMKAYIFSEVEDPLTEDVFQMAKVKVSDNATILISSSLPLEKVKNLLDSLTRIK